MISIARKRAIPKKAMFLIVGLGNPGEKFKNSRHNAGFFAVDQMASRWLDCSMAELSRHFKLKKKLQARILKLDAKRYSLAADLFLIKPQTFMNKSGVSLKKIFQFFNLTIKQCSHLYIIHDDLDLSLGDYKIQFGRTAAGHKGVQSVIDHLGTKNFWRLRVGIENRPAKKIPGEKYVLQPFLPEEKESIRETVGRVTEEIEKIIKK